MNKSYRSILQYNRASLQTSHGNDLFACSFHRFRDIVYIALFKFQFLTVSLSAVGFTLILGLLGLFHLSILLFVLPTVPLDLHAIVHRILVSGHIFHVSKTFSTQITRKVSDSKMNSDSVSVEIKLSFKLFATV